MLRYVFEMVCFGHYRGAYSTNTVMNYEQLNGVSVTDCFKQTSRVGNERGGGAEVGRGGDVSGRQ